jgi:hypothetical protein
LHHACILSAVQRELEDRYEPMPGLAGLPGFLWRKLPRAGKVAVVASGLAAVALAIALSPGIQRSKEDRARADAAERARMQRLELAQTRREQRPRFGRGTPAGTDLQARHALVASAAASIRSDANTRSAAGEFNGPTLRVECQPYPPTEGSVRADRLPSRRAGRYGCLAVTSDVPATSGNRGGVLGHPYRVRIDFKSGRYAFCKIRGRPGELAVRTTPSVSVPRVCGG